MRLVCLITLALTGAYAATADQSATVKRYCAGCHNSSLKSGGLALDKTNPNNPVTDAETWEKVIRRLRVRSMPPAGLPRPDEATYKSLVSSLEGSIDQAAAARPNPGRTDTFRRLNRAEYHNAIRDLLALEVDVSALLPIDESSHGFDNVTVGDLSPTLLDRYLAAAQKIGRLSVGAPVKSPGGTTVSLPPDLTQEEHLEGLPLGTRGGLAMPHTFPLDADYEFVVRLQRDRNEHVEGLTANHQVEILLDGERIGLFTVKPPAGTDHSKADLGLTVRIPVKAGPHTVAATFPKQRSTLLEQERQPWHARFNMDRHPRTQPAIFSVTVNGPYNAKGPGDSPSRRRLLVCRPSSQRDEEACAGRIISTLARRAWRRPVNADELRGPMRFFHEGRAAGDFENGVEMAVRSVLVSPEFLFRIEVDPAGGSSAPYSVGDLALASRLSFFLWSSIPDDELLEVAAAGKLKTQAVFEKQVRRMLADSRSASLVNNFAEQWLYLRNLASITPDMRLFPDFDDNLRQSFRRETELLFESVMREDRSVLDLLRGRYTYLDERLAKHYGIPNIYGSRFRRVEFPEGGERGGLLRQGSILMVTSYATRTSPVIRGKWILSNILGVPPPPPPENVPALKENTISSKLSVRERTSQHRADPVCSGCHNLMDPPGFALENYDAVGRYRRSEDGVRIDASGALPDGAGFDGVEGLQKGLLARPEVFAGTFTEKLLTYALGRGVEYYDAPAVRKIVRSSGEKDYRFSEFILGIVNSAPFRMRRSPT
ncbi:MAG: DUF1592 domain-containing protein [Bryobacteraceae bacterium]|nr:DUF1592 domain-containing protein [Bryobacteraceae bacterium]